MSEIEIKNLSKQFGTFRAVSDISFTVEKNRVIGFLGPNGAGKTTTIRMMVGLSKPTEGEISIAGKRVVFGESEANRNIGYLPEQPAFYGWMRGVEYLSFVADVFGLAEEEKEKRIKKLLEMVDLKAAGKKKISTYSNGMKQRLGIAQALINDPKVLIMDEPVSALDPIGRREVLSIIENLRKEKTIFLSTHILADVDRICDDVIIINKGQIAAISPLLELKEKYAKPILEVEFSKNPGKLIDDLEKEKWLTKLERNGNSIKIWPKDRQVIESNLPLKYFAGQEIGIVKYGLNLPDVEDLFVELLEDK